MKALNVRLEDFITPENLENFISYLRLEKGGGLAEGSIERYLLNLKHLCLQAGQPLLNIKTYAEISGHLRKIRASNGWSSSTTKNAADSYSVFFNWATRFSLIDFNDNPMRLGHEFKNKDSKQLDFFEWADQDFKKLMYNPNNSVRDNAILHTLRSAGPRASDLCNFTFKDVNLEERWLFVRNGKGGKDRYVPFDEENRQHLIPYMASLKMFSSQPWVFQTEDFQKLKPHTLYQMVRRKCEKIGIYGYPHKFRRSLGGEMIANGSDLTDVQQVLGHASPQTTARHYIHHKKQRLKQRYDVGVPKFGLQTA